MTLLESAVSSLYKDECHCDKVGEDEWARDRRNWINRKLQHLSASGHPADFVLLLRRMTSENHAQRPTCAEAEAGLNTSKIPEARFTWKHAALGAAILGGLLLKDWLDSDSARAKSGEIKNDD